ncbi:hypothetical protein C8J56DRAFT_558570 [Mycena floridula]|nr:hypothetical protein C8J56DRAFT_558570 [Mycena floridula]
MIVWSDPAEIAKDAAVFDRIIYTFLGVVIWELFTTWDFELSLITRRRAFRWPLGGCSLTEMSRLEGHLPVFFFLCRYCILLAFVGLLISITVTTPINCGALYTYISWAGNTTILSASTCLMLRTIALWERRMAVVIPLGLLCIAHYVVLFRTMFIVSASWSDAAGACVVTQTNPSLLRFTYFLTMGFDFVILTATFVALMKKHTARTDLWKLLFKDGLVYFLVSFSTNCIPAVLNVLDLNEPMNVSIASCRAVMRLLDFNSTDVYIMSGITNSNPPRQNIPPFPKFGARPEIHVTTEHITMSEFP